MIIRFKFILLLSFLIGHQLITKAQTIETIAGTQGLIGNMNGNVSLATFNNPHGVEYDHQGNIFIADRYNHLIRKIDINGNVTTFAGSGSSGSSDGQGEAASFNEPWGLTVDSIGNVYVADTKNNKIRKITPTGYVTTLAGAGSFGIKDSPNPLIATFGNPTGVAIDKNGNLYIGDHLTHLIRKIDTNGEVTTLAGNRSYPNNYGLVDGIGQNARFNRPYGIEVDKEGNIFVADEWNHAIRKVTPSGIVSTIGGNGVIGSQNGNLSTSSYNYPWDVAIDSLGNVFVADGFNYVIRKIDLNNISTKYAGIMGVTGAIDGDVLNGTFNGATSISFNKEKTSLIVGDAYNQLIRRIYYEDIVSPVINFTNSSNSALQVCENTAVNIEVNGTFSSYEVYIDNNLTNTISSNSTSLNFLPIGIHTVIFKGLKGGYSPSNSNQLTIEVTPNNTFDLLVIPSTDLCEGDSATIKTSDLSVVTWNTGEISDEIIVKNDGEYYVTSIENQCLVKKDTSTINFHPLPDPVILKSSNGPYYIGDSVYLSVSGGNSYLWSTQSTSNQIIVKTSGNYSVEADNGYGCKVTSETISFNFEERPFLLTVSSPNGNYFCFGDSVEIYANQPNNLQWYLDGNMLNGETNDTLVAKEKGIYSFSFETPTDTTLFSEGKQIFENSLPEIDYTYEIINRSTSEISIDFVPSNLEGVLYEWEINDELISENLNFSYDFKQNNINDVSLSISNVEGCRNTITKKIEIVLDEPIFVPTGFTPNFDGLNDVVYVRGVSENSTINFMIFNEWGQLVFSSASVEKGWDGSFNGNIANMGNYTYMLQVTKYNISKTYNGIITLIK